MYSVPCEQCPVSGGSGESILYSVSCEQCPASGGSGESHVQCIL